jgi:hypothetical protein
MSAPDDIEPAEAVPDQWGVGKPGPLPLVAVVASEPDDALCSAAPDGGLRAPKGAARIKERGSRPVHATTA